jgi:hypothetical protein
MDQMQVTNILWKLVQKNIIWKAQIRQHNTLPVGLGMDLGLVLVLEVGHDKGGVEGGGT